MKIRLQAKYTISIMAVILSVVLTLLVIVRFAFPEDGTREAEAAQQRLEEARAAADAVTDGMERTRVLAEALVEPMATGDTKSVERLMASAKGRSVVFVIAADRHGGVFTAGQAQGTIAPTPPVKPEITRVAERFDVTFPVRDSDRVLGSVQVGFRFSRTARAITEPAKERDPRAVGVLVGGLIGAGLLFAVIAAARLSRPVRDLAQSAGTVAAGNWTAPLPRGSGNDEIAEVGGYLASLRDLLVRTRASEKLLRGIIDSLNEGLIVASPDGNIRLANHAVTQMFGYSLEDLRGRPFSALVAQPRKFTVAAATDEPSTECWFLHRDGRLMPVAVSRSTLGSEEQPDQVYVLRDIAERKRLEDELWLYRSRLEQLVVERTKELTTAIQELESFSYSVSHDLHAPLRAINGFGAVLREDYGDYLDQMGNDYLDRISKATVRMGQLIDGLLTLSRVVRIEIRKDDVDLSALASDVAAEITLAEAPRQATFRIAPQLQAKGDPALLRLLLQNLFSNAWKFTKNRGSALIEFARLTSDDQTVFFVRDNGAGFDPAFAQRLFQPFQRLHDADDFPGTGIGLATAQRIIQRHGGLIWAEAEVDAGATFYFSLPQESADQDDEPVAHVEERRVSARAPLS